MSNDNLDLCTRRYAVCVVEILFKMFLKYNNTYDFYKYNFRNDKINKI